MLPFKNNRLCSIRLIKLNVSGAVMETVASAVRGATLTFQNVQNHM